MVGHAGSVVHVVHVDVTDPIQGQGHGASKVPKIALFCIYVFSATLALSSKLMVGSDSMLDRARFSNFLLGKLSRELKLRGISRFHEIQMTIFPTA